MVIIILVHDDIISLLDISLYISPPLLSCLTLFTMQKQNRRPYNYHPRAKGAKRRSGRKPGARAQYRY